MDTVAIGGRVVGPRQPCLVVAEAGVNHDGDLSVALQLVDAAAEAGADAVKFQMFQADRLVAAGAPKAPYQLETTATDESQHEMLARLELGADAHRRLAERASQRGLLFLSAPFDEESLRALVELGVPAIKLPSPDLTNPFLLEAAARSGKPLLVSTGMADLDEVARAMHVLRAAGAREVVLLHCVSSYPADPREANLRAMRTLESKFGVPVGFSDHTLGTDVALAAVALGAAVLEKHFTLDRTRPGPDHRASLEPGELKQLVRSIRDVEAALGDGEKKPAASEQANRTVVRRSLAARVDLAEGTVLREEFLTALRPATGIAADQLHSVVGRTLRRPVAAGELLDPDALA